MEGKAWSGADSKRGYRRAVTADKRYTRGSMRACDHLHRWRGETATPSGAAVQQKKGAASGGAPTAVRAAPGTGGSGRASTAVEATASARTGGAPSTPQLRTASKEPVQHGNVPPPPTLGWVLRPP